MARRLEIPAPLVLATDGGNIFGALDVEAEVAGSPAGVPRAGGFFASAGGAPTETLPTVSLRLRRHSPGERTRVLRARARASAARLPARRLGVALAAALLLAALVAPRERATETAGVAREAGHSDRAHRPLSSRRPRTRHARKPRSRGDQRDRSDARRRPAPAARTSLRASAPARRRPVRLRPPTSSPPPRAPRAPALPAPVPAGAPPEFP